MKDFELLAPAGSMDALIAAVQNGCDAVYLGGPSFGARAFANNFDDEEMQEALRYAHQYGVRIFVTMNTIIYENELQAALDYAKKLYMFGVDALIIQDLGLLSEIRRELPDIELHASTQMHVHNKEGIDLLKTLQVKRVVLPRETPISEIQRLCKEGLDVEIFVQGALCVSYSGQCLMSSLDKGRSGNRGECAQHCRMRYTLHNDSRDTDIETDGEYLLSPKDLCTLENIDELMKAGVYSFKIEGRMKRAEYVAQMVKSYRKAIDAGRKKYSKEQDIEEMKTIFYRGYTKGFIFDDHGSRFISSVRPNHLGIKVGEVVYQKGTKVGINLTSKLSQFDGIRFIQREDVGGIIQMMYKDGLLVNGASAGDFIEIEFREAVEKGASVHMTSDYAQLQSLQRTYTSTQRRVRVSAQVMMFHNQKATIQLIDEEDFFVSVESDSLVAKSDNEGLSDERIRHQLQKTGATIYELDSCEVYSDDNIAFAIKDLNALRRAAFDELQKLRENRYPDRIVSEQQIEFNEYSRGDEMVEVKAIIRTMEQYEGLKDLDVTTIFVNDEQLYESIKSDSRVQLRTRRVNREGYAQDDILAQELGAASRTQRFVADTSIPCVNSATANFLLNQGATEIIRSLEIDDYQFEQMINHTKSRFGMYVYSYDEVMTMDYCPVHTSIIDNDKKNCQLCKVEQYSLIGLNKDKYLLQGDEECRMHLYRELRDDLSQVEDMYEEGIRSFYVSFLYEDRNQVRSVVSKIINKTAVL